VTATATASPRTSVPPGTPGTARPIDQRFMPKVGGIDLEQSLNYIAVADAGEKFCYDYYTGSRLFYKPGSRPVLERLAKEITAGATDARQASKRLAAWVAKEVAWAGFHWKDKGERLTTDLGLSEEELIAQGYGWCNEQVRVMCGLTQTLGITSRIVFACNKEGNAGHCVTEVLLPGAEGWMMIDQSFGYAFEMNGEPVRAVDVWGDPIKRAYFSPIYKKLCADLRETLGGKPVDKDFSMSIMPNPLDGFEVIGFHNHFIR
jgi:transglutaminase-like putative cysteine protease